MFPAEKQRYQGGPYQSITVLILCVIALHSRGVSAGIPPQPNQVQAQLQHKLTRFIETQMQRHGVVGLSITLVDDQKTVFSRGFGYQDRESRIPATAQTVYRMGSISKIFTAVAIMQLVEAGKIDLAAAVTRYLPEFELKSRTPLTPPITIRQLLTHHSGMPTDLMKGADTLHPEGLGDLIDRLKDEYTAFEPGNVFLYSNLGYAVLGRLVEVVSGQSYESYMRRYVLKPLAMHQSGFHPDSDMIHQLATGYMNGNPGTPYPMREVSAGALYASTADIAQFIHSVFLGGAPLLQAHTQSQMLARQNEDCPLDLDISMGLGWQLTPQLSHDENAGLNAWHDGWLWHFASYMLLLPEHKLGVIVATNSDSGKKAVRTIAQKAIQYLLWQKAGVQRSMYTVQPSVIQDTPSFSPPSLEDLAGNYDTASGLFTLINRGDYLEGMRNGHPVVLSPIGNGLYEMKRKINSVAFWKSPELDGVYFQFIPVGDQMVLATMDGDVRIPFGHRVAPVPIPGIWIKRTGTWSVSERHNDFAYIQNIRIEHQTPFLTAHVDIGCKDGKQMTLHLLLKPVSYSQAQVMGIGRYRGDMLTIERDGHHGVQLRFQGYILKYKRN
ncbi:MAG: beta-lactamase family protein [Deltaproteobacteria bacterium]|nr:beta-lactamase family protein [Deltaproteobacteria bacterium]